MGQRRLAEWEEVSVEGLAGEEEERVAGGGGQPAERGEVMRGSVGGKRLKGGRDSAGRGMNPAARRLLRLNEWCCS